ncbi:MAG: thioredoxin domain-containing protein, partial [Nitrospinota bacterium]|nr:thioredoxin domain-containing protein [Nitrospinota bacterium]
MNSRRHILISAVLLLLAATAPLQADGFYKWVDENGETHYSDSQSGPPADAKNVQEKSFDDIEYNVTPAVEYRPSSYADWGKKKSKGKKKSRRSKASAGSLPWFTKSNFDYEVLRSDQLTLVEFWAIWCGVCRKVDPVINDLAGKYSSK